MTLRFAHDQLAELITFGLAKMSTQWAGTVATLALNVVAVPCATCGNRRKGGFWNNHDLTVSQRDCAKHPSWNRLQAAGYTTFLGDRRLQQFH